MAYEAVSSPPRFLQRIASKIHHDTEAESPNVLAYMTLVDRILEDRTIDEGEEDTLVHAALSWNLSSPQLETAHAHYIHNLAIAALSDGVVTDSERRDLHLVARLLGHDESSLDSVLESAANQLALVHLSTRPSVKDSSLAGQRVCFTGQLRSTSNGQLITRGLAEAYAVDAGLIVASGVTKALDLLVVADPNTQSGKAKKARDYGTRILAEDVFWRMIGVTTD
jgi:DNA polymerase-3 subunit epsilon